MQKSAPLRRVIPFIIMLSACSKHHDTPAPVPTPPVNNPQSAKPLLDSMVWHNLVAPVTTYFAYRPDSLQDKITTVDPFVSDTVRFEYYRRQVTHITNNRLNRSSDYEYDPAGKIIAITITGFEGTQGLFRFEYGYDVKGRVSTQAYYLVKGTDKRLESIVAYEYDGHGLLSKISGITPDGLNITYTIDAYTEECNFNPWTFIDPVDLSEGMEIYNLPVLQSLTRLPSKITKTITGGSDGGFTKQLTATLQGGNLARAITLTQYPTVPTSNYQVDVELFYRH
jgi:YD repeat-containing protein